MVVAPLWRSNGLRGVPGVIGVEVPKWLHSGLGIRIARALGMLFDPLAISWRSALSRELVVHRTYYFPSVPLPRVPTVITVHDMIHELNPNDFPTDDPTARQKRAWCTKADLIIAISEHTARQAVERLNLDPARIRVVHHGVSYLLPDEERLEGLRRRQPFILYVGSRGGYKNFNALLRAYAQTDSCREGVDLVAFGGGPATPSELKLIRTLGLDDRLRFSSGDDGALASHYAAALALIYPSLDEGFGLPPLEAMLHGCPVAAAKEGAIPEVSGPAVLLFDPKSTEELRDAIDRIIGDETLRRKLMELGQVHASRFSWSACAARTLAAYTSARQAFEAR